MLIFGVWSLLFILNNGTAIYIKQWRWIPGQGMAWGWKRCPSRRMESCWDWNLEYFPIANCQARGLLGKFQLSKRLVALWYVKSTCCILFLCSILLFHIFSCKHFVLSFLIERHFHKLVEDVYLQSKTLEKHDLFFSFFPICILFATTLCLILGCRKQCILETLVRHWNKILDSTNWEGKYWSCFQKLKQTIISMIHFVSK